MPLNNTPDILPRGMSDQNRRDLFIEFATGHRQQAVPGGTLSPTVAGAPVRTERERQSDLIPASRITCPQMA